MKIRHYLSKKIPLLAAFVISTGVGIADNPKNLPRVVIIECCPCEEPKVTNGNPNEGTSAGTTGTGAIGALQLRAYEQSPSPVFFSPSSLALTTGAGIPGFVEVGDDGNGNPTITKKGECTVYKFTLKPEQPDPDPKTACAGTTAGNGSTTPTPTSPTPQQTYNIITADGSQGLYTTTATATQEAGTLIQYKDASGRVVDITPEILDAIRQDGALRQVKSISGLSDIQLLPNEGQGYVINFYPAAQVGSKNSNGVYTFNGSPARSMKVENPQWEQGRFNQIQITQTEGARSSTTSYNYSEGNRQWTQILPDGSRIERWETMPTTGIPPLAGEGVPPASTTSLNYFIRLKERYDAQNVKVGATRYVYWQIDTEEERLLQEIKDFGGINNATTYTYYTNANDRATYGKARSRFETNGKWEYYVYDTAGRMLKTYAPWLDAGMPASVPTTDANFRVTEYSYAAVTTGDVAASGENRPHLTVERVNGIETGRRYNAYFKDNATGERREIEERAVAQGASYGATGNLRTTTVYFSDTADAASSGRVKSSKSRQYTDYLFLHIKCE